MERDGNFECRMSGFFGLGERGEIDQDDFRVWCSTLIAFSMLDLGDGDGVDGGEDIPCQEYYMRDRRSKSLSLHRRCRVPGLGPVCLSIACWESSL